MKSILKGFFGTIILLMVAAVIFYFWAKQPQLGKDNYTQIKTHKTLQTAPDSIFTIATYNIGYLSGMTNNKAIHESEAFYQKNLGSALAHLKKLNADVVAFQEIDLGAKRSYHVNQNDVIADSLYAYSATAVNWDKTYVPFPYWPIDVNFGEMLSGQSVTSKYELTDHERIVLQKVESNPFYYNAFYLDRLAQVVTVKHPVKDITIINIHVEAFDQTTRIAQLKDVLNLAKEKAKAGAVVLLGDFNSDPDFKDAACKMFYTDDVFAGTDPIDNNNYKDSFPSDVPVKRLDYIFYTQKDFVTEESRVLNEFGTVSDHLPVYAALRMI